MLHDIPHYRANTETPKWFHPYASIYFYETQSWADIAKWAASIYDNVIENTDEVNRIAKDINSTYHTPKEQVAAALNYVQSNIRYLGIEMGTNSHMPSPPNETLNRRYGDCKDKTVLFISILKAMGIQVSPVLVGTDIKHHLSNLPPVANVFDHVITKVMIDKEIYWLDPTRSYQTGKLDNIFQPDYGYGLVVDSKTDALESMDNHGNIAKKVIHDIYDLHEGPEHNATFQCTTEHIGYFAEKLRYDIASNGITALQKKYVDFYSSYYTRVKALANLEEIDDPNTGNITQKEKYSIEKFWEYDKKEQEYSANFYADSIAPYLSKPEQIKRNSPYAISHPIDIQHTIEVKLDDINWSLPNKETVIDNAFFYLKSQMHYDKSARQMTLAYDFKSKTDHVPADKTEAYLSEVKKASDLLEYGIVQYDQTSADEKNIQDDGDDMTESIIVLSLALLYFGGLIYTIVSWRMDAKKEPDFEEVFYYPVSLPKLLILSFVSFGLYMTYWFYRNNLYKKIKEDSSIMPIARGIFFTFWYYPLYASLYDDSMQRFNENKVLFKPLAILFAVLFFIVNLLGNKDGAISIVFFIMPLFLIPLANYINVVNGMTSAVYIYNSKWKLRHTVLVLLTVPLILLTIAEELNVMPNAKVVKGDQLMGYDVRYMQRKNVFPSNETILYFYSDAFWSIRDDGNGFTKNHVFSYWKEDGKLKVEKAHFSDIEEITVTYDDDRTSNTTITIARKDGSTFPLYISTDSSLDKVFAKELQMRWEMEKIKR